MKKKYKFMISALVVCLLFVLTIFLFTRPKSYEKSYKVSDYEITETFDKKNNYYKFSLKQDGTKYEIVTLSKYMGKKLIDDVKVLEDEEKGEKCILFKSGKLSTYPQCKNGEGLIDYDLTSIKDDDFYKRDELELIESKHDNAKFLRPLDMKFLVWDNKGYIYVDEKGEKEIHFLENESYYNNHSIQVGKYVLTPNYDEDYVFSSFYIIDMEKGKLTSWKLDEEISRNFYYLGVYDEKLYLVDRKNRKEFSLYPKRKKMELVSIDDEGIVWNNDWEKVSLTKLVSENYYFNNEKAFNYSIENDKLYLQLIDSKKSMLVSDKEITKFITMSGNKAFYLVKDKLYSYSTLYGEQLLAEYSEWNFNNINSIFIY